MCKQKGRKLEKEAVCSAVYLESCAQQNFYLFENERRKKKTEKKHPFLFAQFR